MSIKSIFFSIPLYEHTLACFREGRFPDKATSQQRGKIRNLCKSMNISSKTQKIYYFFLFFICKRYTIVTLPSYYSSVSVARLLSMNK